MTARRTIQLFGLGQQAKSAVISAQRHLNLYAEIVKDPEKSTVSYIGTPGLDLFTAAFGDTPHRGWMAIGDLFYTVHRGTLWEVNNAGVRTSRGTLNTTSGRVCMAYDGAVILIVDGTNGYTYTIATTTFAEVTDAQFPDGARTCGWLAGQFVVDTGSSDSFFTSPDGSSWDALDFATAESAPDGLERVFVDNGELVLAGSKTMEFWSSTGGQDFQFTPVNGATQEFGLASRWSMTKFNSGIAALMKNAQGQVQVMFITGYTPRPLSGDIDAEINSYATVSDATTLAYMHEGHPMLQVNFPSAGKSWLFDAKSGMWSPLEYGTNGARHRGEMFLDFINRRLVADYENGNIYEFNSDTYTDNGTVIAREMIGRHIVRDNKPLVVAELFVDMETGVGLATGQGSDPQAMLTYSRDGGRTWSNECWTTIGAIGKYLTRVVWRRLGAARDWAFKIRITDPVRVVFTYAAMRVR